jgi:serine/threonine protein kinase
MNEDSIPSEALRIGDLGLTYISRYKPATRGNTLVGMLPYVAPEVVIWGESSLAAASDVWAAGCIGFELCSGNTLPHTRGTQSADAYLESGQIQQVSDLSEIPSRFSNLVSSIIGRCLVSDVSSRPTAATIRDHIFQGIRESDLNVSQTASISNSTVIPPENDPLIESSRDGNDSLDAEWQTISHIDIDPNVSGDSGLTAKAQKCGEPMTSIEELTREFEQGVVLDDPLEPNADDLSWTTGDDPMIMHKAVIDKGASGEVHEVFPIS